MKYIIFVVLFVSMISSCSDENVIFDDQEVEIETREGENICVMTWNTFLLDTPGEYLAWANPLLAIGKPQCEGQDCIDRALLICESIKDANPDVVNLQEVWEEEAADALADCLSEAGYTVLIDETCDGLMTATKLKVNSSTSIPFDDDNGWISCSNDWWKDKGFQVSELEIEEGCSFNNVNLHLDAGDCSGDEEARVKNILQMKTYMKSLKTTIPTLYGGDWNIDLNSNEISSLSPLRSRFTYDIGSGTAIETAKGYGVLDYFLYRGGNNQFTDFHTETIIPCFIVEQTQNQFEVIKVDQGIETVFGIFGTQEEALQVLEDLKVNFVDSYTRVNLGVTKRICDEDLSDHLPVQTCFKVNCSNIDNTEVVPGDYYPMCTEDGDLPCPPGYECLGGDCCHIVTGECLPN